METRDLLETQLRDVLAAYCTEHMGFNDLCREASRLVTRILRLRTERLLSAMKFVHALEEINDAWWKKAAGPRR